MVGDAHAPSPLITRRLGAIELRQSLQDCGKINYTSNIVDLDNVSDDRLPTLGHDKGFAFNQCMSEKGWVSAPDVLYSP